MQNKSLTLESDRLILRDFVETDWSQVFSYQSNPLYLRYYPWEKRTKQNVIDLINCFITWKNERPRIKFQLAIILKAENKLIGNCGIRKANISSSEGELGCEFDPHYWGQGFAFEAVSTLIKYSFEILKLHRVWAMTKLENQAAIKLVEKLHFQNEGRLREQEWLHDHWSDSLIYAILEQEWKGHVLLMNEKQNE